MQAKAKVYIAGPMTGYQHFNYPAFETAKAYLEKNNWDVVSPVDEDIKRGWDVYSLPDDWDWNTHPGWMDYDATIQECMTTVQECNAIFMLNGWKNSHGAVKEYWQARDAKLLVMHQYNMADYPTAEPVEDHGGHAKPVRDTPKDAIGARKAPLQLIPDQVLIGVSECLYYGAYEANSGKGYGAWNWRTQNTHAMQYIGALRRHISAWVDGEEDATDSMCHHIDHAMATLMVLRDSMLCGTMTDDRPPSGRAWELIESYSREKPDGSSCVDEPSYGVSRVVNPATPSCPLQSGSSVIQEGEGGATPSGNGSVLADLVERGRVSTNEADDAPPSSDSGDEVR